MNSGRGWSIRARALLAGVAGCAVMVGVTNNGAPVRAAAPPVATFTKNVKADGGKGSGQNEPQVAVDQLGYTYVTWQSSSSVSRTLDGVNFTQLGYPDPANTTAGDVAIVTTTWPSANHISHYSDPDANGVFWSDLARATCGAFQIRAATSQNLGATWNAADATCQGGQVDRNWIAAYTPKQYQGKKGAVPNSVVYNVYHDFGVSNIWVTTSKDGGATWGNTAGIVQNDAIEPGSMASQTSPNNSIPGSIVTDLRGPHAGRVYVVWSTSDVGNNASQGGNTTQAEPFDHIFTSYSDDQGSTWHSRAAFHDPCAPNPPVSPPPGANTCQDVSELFTPMAVDDAGNVYVAFVWRDVSAAQPQYDIYLEVSHDGGETYNGGTPDQPGKPIRVTTDAGTHYMPWITAGSAGGVDIVYYSTPYIEGVGFNNKPAAAPDKAVWDVYMSQTLDGGKTFTQSKISDAHNLFGDQCSTGIFCGVAPANFGWGQDRTLLDDFGVAIGPDGGARVAWTDTRDSWTKTCNPDVSPNDDTTAPCQRDHIYFACQNSGVGLHGETITGCGANLEGTGPNNGTAAVATPAASPSAAPAVSPTPTGKPLPNTTGQLPPWSGLLLAIPTALAALAMSRRRTLRPGAGGAL